MDWVEPWSTLINEKLITVGLFYEILNNFVAVLVFDRFKFPLIGIVAHLEN